MKADSPTLPLRAAISGEGLRSDLARRLEAAAVSIRTHPLAPLLIVLGVGLRVGRYLQDRSIWLDEAMLALNLTSRSYSHLFGTLDFEQGAPPAFLLLEKFAISAFGDSERVLRLFPLLAGIASVPLFWGVASRFLHRTSALVALAFFAVLEPFVYYSSETKQYAFDVLVALVLVWLFDRALSSDRLMPIAVFAVAGYAAPWFSHPSVFVLAGTGGALFLAAVATRDRRKLAFVSGAMVLWIASFLAAYLTTVEHLNSHLSSGVQVVTAEQARVLKNVYVLFSDPGTLPRDLLALTLVLVALGAVILARDDWRRFTALALTLVAAMIAGEAQRYPLSGRWALFLLPLAVLPLALGAVSLIRLTQMPVRAVAYATVVILFAASAWTAFANFEHLPKKERSTPATLQPTESLLHRLAGLWGRGDTLYVSVKSQYAFRYYLTCHDCNPYGAAEARLWPFRPVPGPTQTSPALIPERSTLVVGSAPGDLASYLDDFGRLEGKSRVWFLFMQTWPIDESALEFWLNRQGRPITIIHEGGAALVLYDLRSSPKAAAATGREPASTSLRVRQAPA